MGGSAVGKKTQANKGGRRVDGSTIAIVVGVVAVLALLGVGIVQNKGVADRKALLAERLVPNQYGCTPSPVKAEIPGLEREDCKSAGHVNEKVTYETDPPTSGAHHPTWVSAGFYTEPQQTERLVHSLEHGNVVIYYDQSKLEQSQVDALRAITRKYGGNWDGVVAVPRTGGDHPIILTAWEHRLRLGQYDKNLIDTFVDEFRGRGPENPMRPLQR